MKSNIDTVIVFFICNTKHSQQISPKPIVHSRNEISKSVSYVDSSILKDKN